MVTIKFEYLNYTEKFFEKHKSVKEKFENAMYSFYMGNKIDIKKMKGTKEPCYRVRLNDYRIIFSIKNGEIVIISTFLAGNRGEVYKKFKNLKG